MLPAPGIWCCDDHCSCTPTRQASSEDLVLVWCWLPATDKYYRAVEQMMRRLMANATSVKAEKVGNALEGLVELVEQ